MTYINDRTANSGKCRARSDCMYVQADIALDSPQNQSIYSNFRTRITCVIFVTMTENVTLGYDSFMSNQVTDDTNQQLTMSYNSMQSNTVLYNTIFQAKIYIRGIYRLCMDVIRHLWPAFSHSISNIHM